MKRILLILSFILSITITSQGQRPNAGDGNGPIVRFYPNPATTNINFEFPNNESYNIQIFSFLGRKMTEVSNASSKTTINLSDFARGMYVYKLIDRSGKLLETGKFQVSK